MSASETDNTGIDEKQKSEEPENKKEKDEKSKRYRQMKNICLLAVCGYILGVIISGLSFSVMITIYDVEPVKAAWISASLGVFSSLGLSFNKSLRCNVVLVIPVICSVKGRSFLVAYALVLTATGPLLNITKNFEVLSRSLTCGQEQLKEALKKILEVIKKPLIAIKNAIKIALDELKKVLKQIEEVFKVVVAILKKLLNTIKSAFSWLGGRSSVCDKELGNPFERCIKMADDTMKDCEATMKLFKPLCHVTKIFNGLCYALKLFDVFCQFKAYVSDLIVNKVINKIKEFQESLRNIFDASVNFDHDFHFATNQSKDWSEVGQDIMGDVRNELKNFFFLFGFTELFAFLMFIRIFLKTMYYKHKYMQSNRYDNYFVTKEFKNIDARRKKMGKELALPLTRKERRRYVKITSIVLVKQELLKMARSIMFLIITNIQITCVCLIDYGLFSVLNTMRQVGLNEEPLQPPQFFGVDVSGAGFLADIYKGVINSFEPLAAKYDIDATPCLPNPRQVNFKRYYKIGAVLLLCWVFLFIQPYALRLRQVIMSSFYPDRAKERSVWLYNQILLKRSSFIKMARRQARSRILKDSTAERVSCMDWVRAKTNRWWIFRKIFGEGKGLYCILCATYLKPPNLVKCETPQCKGAYCPECYRESENICCLCKSPIDYGDASDVSEEVDSDELGEVKVNKYCP